MPRRFHVAPSMAECWRMRRMADAEGDSAGEAARLTWQLGLTCCFSCFLGCLFALVVAQIFKHRCRKRTAKTFLPWSLLQSLCLCWRWCKCYRRVLVVAWRFFGGCWFSSPSPIYLIYLPIFILLSEQSSWKVLLRACHYSWKHPGCEPVFATLPGISKGKCSHI